MSAKCPKCGWVRLPEDCGDGRKKLEAENADLKARLKAVRKEALGPELHESRFRIQGILRKYFYLRDEWRVGEVVKWARHDGYYYTLKEAQRAAADLAKRIGKGSRVQIVKVLVEVFGEERG